MIDKIQAVHRQRLAVVYLRQSTLRQVLDHPESARRQYALRDRAIQLGWPKSAVEIIDEDLGQSGADSARRHGFQRLSEQVAQGRVGAIFVLEVSRLSRSSADWHRLLDLCGVADVVLVDEQAVYHPADPNDRLLLGIKGTMSEAERGWIQLRLRGARVSKARRGDYRLTTPAGYVWDRATSRLRLDPDEEVQHAIRLVFDRFRIERSAYGVTRYFIQHGLRLPARSTDGTTARWSAPRSSRIISMLHNPTYAGAYVYGRRGPNVEMVDGRMVRRLKRISPDAWHILIRDHHPAYIRWEDFVENQRILQNNRLNVPTPEHHGAAREGEALLQGLVLCGRCGHRMHITYNGTPRRARYCCASPLQQGRETQRCWTVAAGAIDKSVSELVLNALTPEAIALGMAVAGETERQAADLDRQWTLRLEQARYEAQMAERRYKAVEPEHRTVARTLEREWDAKLREVERLEREYGEVRTRDKISLTTADRAHIANLSRDVPRIWNASTTTMAQRKAMLRTMVSEVCLTPIRSPDGGTHIRLLWQTGATSEFAVPRQLPGQHTSQEAVTMIRRMVARMMRAGQIAAALNGAQIPTATGCSWTPATVHSYCRYHGIRWPRPLPTSVPQPERRADGAYSIRGVARRLRVTASEVRYWSKCGWITSIDGGGRGRALWFHLDPATLVHLRQVRKDHVRPRRRPPQTGARGRTERHRPRRRAFTNRDANGGAL
ncbi:recombinase family protein [Sorangium atrum]|uniref:Recombinase family protein n=1 Tax=Sorangium atrum TaxID=2995308 RepID=A0ABT5BXW0_9BACT|nr:recombinase family protein [Sorangium aterium]MDC0678995.1 recombinase family protein [Sorangium aterium]